MHSVLSCLVTDVIGPASIAEDLVATVAAEFDLEGGIALREYIRSVEIVGRALGLEPGDRVILSPLAPGIYRRALEGLGVEIVVADVREEDACLDPRAVSECLDDSVKAIFVHAPYGRVPDLGALEDLGVPVVNDIGEALGARDAKGELGARGRYVLLPMEANGIATAGGGTLVLAADKAALSTLNAAAGNLSADAFLPDLNASLGLVQWREYPQFLESRDLIADAYRRALMKGRHRTLADPRDEDARAIPYSFPVVLESGLKEVRSYARKKGIETEAAFSGRVMDGAAGSEETCPTARTLMMGTVLFPLYPALGKKNVQLIVKVLSTLP